MKNKRGKIIAVLLIAAVTCSAVILLFLNRIRTIMSLKMVDEYPLYYMRYYGDYNLDYSPVSRIPKSAGSAAAAAEENTIMCSSFLAWNEKGEPLFCRNLDNTLINHTITVLLTDAPGKHASISMADLYYLGFTKNNPPNKSLFKNSLFAAPRVTIDGVNEYGLAVAILSVPYGTPPYDPEKPTTDEVGMMRLILDNAATVGEAVGKIKEYNIKLFNGPAHFMIADASGDSAVIEFIGGAIAEYRTDEPWQVCTNFLFSETSNTYCERYNKATRRLEEKNGILSEEEAMQLLSDVSQDGTVWSVVYNLKTGEVYIAMGKNYDKIYEFDLDMVNE